MIVVKAQGHLKLNVYIQDQIRILHEIWQIFGSGWMFETEKKTSAWYSGGIEANHVVTETKKKN